MRLSRRFILVAAVVLAFLANFTPVHAAVGIEYLGPNPLRPEPIIGQPQILRASGIVGNPGDEAAIFTFTLRAPQDFSYFTPSISDNNFTLDPGARQQFNLTLQFDPNTTPMQNYTATIIVIASPISKNGTSGSAALTLGVVVSASAIPEFPKGATLVLTIVPLIAVLVLLGRSRRQFGKGKRQP